MKQHLIVIEGLDGSGKGTQTKQLCCALERLEIPFRHLTFPDYQEPSSALIKMYLNGEFGMNPSDVNAYAASSFYAVDRFASYRKFWKEDYLNGKWIIADRYATSNLIYQLAKLPREQWDAFIAWEDDFEYGKLGIPQPSRILYLDMPPEISQALLSGRYHGEESKKDIHEKNIEYLKSCREGALYVAQKCGWEIISCASNGQPESIEAIHQKILKTISEEFC